MHFVFDWLDDDVLHMILSRIQSRQRRTTNLVSKRFLRVGMAVLQIELSLSDEQMKCFKDAMRGKNVFITGGAGSGKSHLLKKIIQYKGREGIDVTASTGCAAAIIGAATFHSTCALGLGKAPVRSIVHKIVNENKYAYSRIKSMKTLVVDEVGMLTGRLFDKAGDVIGSVRRMYGTTYDSITSNAQSTVPFDDLQLIICGDALQLPPVDEESEGWIFEAKCWKKLDFKVHVLSQVHRQQDVRFIEILQRMRMGLSTISDLSYLIQNSSKTPIPDCLKLYAVNAPAVNENEMRLAELPGRAHRFCAIDSGSDPNMNESRLKEILVHCPCPSLLILKIGARVMCLKNVSECLSNGSIGTVEDIFQCKNEDGDAMKVCVRVKFDGQLGGPSFNHSFSTHIIGKEVQPENIFTIRGHQNKKLAQRIQIPLRLAWAVSIHKSQGMSLDGVHVDFQRTFASGQAYTALSRVKTLSNCYIRGLKLSHMKMVSPKAINFYTSLDASCEQKM